METGAFQPLLRKQGPAGGPSDGPSDTSSYRDARTHLKTIKSAMDHPIDYLSTYPSQVSSSDGMSSTIHFIDASDWRLARGRHESQMETVEF